MCLVIVIKENECSVQSRNADIAPEIRYFICSVTDLLYEIPRNGNLGIKIFKLIIIICATVSLTETIWKPIIILLHHLSIASIV